jgi:hypothetical protein
MLDRSRYALSNAVLMPHKVEVNLEEHTLQRFDCSVRDSCSASA